MHVSAAFVNWGARFGRAGHFAREIVKGVVSTHVSSGVALGMAVSQRRRPPTG